MAARRRGQRLERVAVSLGGLTRSILAIVVFAGLGAAPAAAELPPDQVLIVRGATVEAAALPSLLILPIGVFSTNELGIRFSQAAFGPDDMLIFFTTTGIVEVVDPADVVLPANEATYYDAEQRMTQEAHVVPGPDGSALLAVFGGQTASLASLLATNGSVVVFPATPVPEPGLMTGIVAGLIGLTTLTRTRARGAG
jgi:hypothetical protein